MDAIGKLKESVINDFYQLIKNFKKANYNIDYQPILSKILFIESFSDLDKVDGIYEKLMII